ncbi:hypothetical protein [Brachybacterium nesterenkovii]
MTAPSGEISVQGGLAVAPTCIVPPFARASEPWLSAAAQSLDRMATLLGE